MIKTLSHIVIASQNVPHMADFFEKVFNISPHFANQEFCDFQLPGKGRVAFFKPVGKSAQFFSTLEQPSQVSYGITVENVDHLYEKLSSLKSTFEFSVSGPPKEHPWGEKSFLLLDPDKNRWEITQSPSKDGYLLNR